MKAPTNSTKINKHWLKFILEEHEKELHPGSAVIVLDFTVNQGIPPGEGFNSELVLVDVTAKLVRPQAPDGEVEKTYFLATKFLHPVPFNAEFVKRFQAHTKEYLLYAKVIHELNNFQAAIAPDDPRILIPDLIYGKNKGSEYVLVMENLKAAGYCTHDKRKGLDLEHVMEAVQQIARVHAVSYAYNKSHGFLEKFPCFEYKKEMNALVVGFLNGSLDNSIKYLRTVKGKEELAQKIENQKPSLKEKFLAVVENQGDILCLCHGDFWNCNLMYKYQQSSEGEQSTIEGVKIIDWGNSSWGNPIHDLQYLLHTSTKLELRRAHLEEILQSYHSLFTSITTKLGAPLPHWDYDAFRKEWDRTYIFGFTLGGMLIPGTLSTTNPASKAPEPSVLDHTALAPVKFLVRGFQTGMAKMTAPFLFGPTGIKLMEKFLGSILKPILKEMMAGTNEVLNSRYMDLITEADEKGLFGEG